MSAPSVELPPPLPGDELTADKAPAQAVAAVAAERSPPQSAQPVVFPVVSTPEVEATVADPVPDQLPVQSESVPVALVNAGQVENEAVQQLSPDGYWRWDGSAWVPAHDASAPTQQPIV